MQKVNVTEDTLILLQSIWNILFEHFDEKCNRLLAAAMTEALGYGGNKIVHGITKLSTDAITLGTKQLYNKEDLIDDRIRRPGAGRKTILELYPEIEKEILDLVDSDAQGDPMSPLRWTSKSLEHIQQALKIKGYIISLPSISNILSKNDFSMQANKKRFEGTTTVERESQFQYINSKVKDAQFLGMPVISVDGKKKENVGLYKNIGAEYRKKGDPKEVSAYDFIGPLGKDTPYGVYDITNNSGFVNVGIDHDTAEFATYSIKQWWLQMGKALYPRAKELLITSDGGGSNSKTSRLWKLSLQEMSNELDLRITVCHFPPGTSKWNRIEHRMFSAISMNWRGQPLVSHEVIVSLIGNTTNKSGLKISAELDTKEYKTGIKISDEDFSKININYHDVNSKLNYTISPN